MAAIQEVWQSNFKSEMRKINVLLNTFNNVAIDTEFPGFVRNSPRYCSDDQRYADLWYNINKLKLIQVGITLFDSGGIIVGSWQVNFSDFDSRYDEHVPASIELLKSNGIDLDKNIRNGVKLSCFSKKFREILYNHRNINWFTFHGLYDLGYLLNLMTKKLPISLNEYTQNLGLVFGTVYDLKFVAGYCPNLLGGELGLEKLAKILDVQRLGASHQAGSDSLLTACVFLKMKKIYVLAEEVFAGYLYGIRGKISRVQQLPIESYYERPVNNCHSYYSAHSMGLGCNVMHNYGLLM